MEEIMAKFWDLPSALPSIRKNSSWNLVYDFCPPRTEMANLWHAEPCLRAREPSPSSAPLHMHVRLLQASWFLSLCSACGRCVSMHGEVHMHRGQGGAWGQHEGGRAHVCVYGALHFEWGGTHPVAWAARFRHVRTKSLAISVLGGN